jgi:hypothetical protein
MFVRFLLISLLIAGNLAGCSTSLTRTVRPGEIAPNSWERFVSVSLRDGSIIMFTGDGGRSLWLDRPDGRVLCIEGVGDRGVHHVIPVRDIAEAVSRSEGQGNAGEAIAVIGFAIGAMAVLTGIWTVR